jgi:regulator of RNase E activity RraA
VPVSIGGMVVAPGDIVVGDDDGVVAFAQDIAVELLQKVRAQEAREAEILKSIREGPLCRRLRQAHRVLELRF